MVLGLERSCGVGVKVGESVGVVWRGDCGSGHGERGG